MKRVDVLRSGLVLEQAKLLKDTKPLLAEALAATLVDEPEAVFLHGELVREHDAALASQIFEGLTTRWPDHPATRRAIARHWTPAPKLTPNGDQ